MVVRKLRIYKSLYDQKRVQHDLFKCNQARVMGGQHGNKGSIVPNRMVLDLARGRMIAQEDVGDQELSSTGGTHH